MATKQSTIDFLLDQLSGVVDVRARKMFGEYALYCNDKVVSLVCDDELFVKITEPGKKFLGGAYEEGFAYKGAKASMHISGDLLEDRQFLAELVRITEKALPRPKPKKTSSKFIKL
jgi:DNA transformation protein